MKYIVTTSKFNPLTFEEQLRPILPLILSYKTNYDALQKDLTEALAIERIVNSLNPNDNEDQIIIANYNDYIKRLEGISNAMSTTGEYLPKEIIDLRNTYKKDIVNIATVDGLLRAMNKSINDDITKDATTIHSAMGNIPSFAELYNNPYLDLYYKVSGKLLLKQVSDKASKIALESQKKLAYNEENKTTITQTIAGYSTEDMLYLHNLIEQAFSDEILSKSLEEIKLYLKDNNIDSMLFLFVVLELDNSGVLSWDNPTANKAALGYIINGLWDAVGGNTIAFEEDDSNTTSNGDNGNNSDNIFLNYPSVSYIGSDVTGNNKGQQLNTEYMTESNPKLLNASILYDKVDADGNITLANNTKINFVEAYQAVKNTENLEQWYDGKWEEWAKSTEGKQYNNDTSKRKNYSKFYLWQKSLSTLNNALKNEDYYNQSSSEDVLKSKIVILNKIFNASYNYKNLTNYSDDDLYRYYIMNAEDSNLLDTDKLLKEDLKKAYTILTLANIDLLQLDKYLPEKVLKNIIDTKNVHKSIEGHLGFINSNITLIPVSELDGTNRGITANLNNHLTMPVYKLKNNSLELDDSETEGLTISKMLDIMPKDDNGDPTYTIYFNPAILHYDNYSFNDLYKNSYMIIFTKEDKLYQFLVNKEALGSNYVLLMDAAQTRYDNSYWYNTPSIGLSRNILNITQDFYNYINPLAVQIRNQSNINPQSAR